VLADICPGERVQEMEGSEEDAEVAWLAACRATKDRSPRFLSCGRDEQEKAVATRFVRRACTGEL
jgi:hypothetical protein